MSVKLSNSDEGTGKIVGVAVLPSQNLPIKFGKVRMGYRWFRYLGWCVSRGHSKGARDALSALKNLGLLSVGDLVSSGKAGRVTCNICGWQGGRFYPNAGSGYYEEDTACPRCHCIDRYRALAAILEKRTEFFENGSSVIEVAPVRTFQAYSLWRKKNENYVSFDLENFGMEKGDITNMRFADDSADYFLCFHVLEHVPDDGTALSEIHRVLKPGGKAILQVPIDYSIDEIVEYGAPNPFETGHVRRYSQNGFAERIADRGFSVETISADQVFDAETIARHGLSREPVFVAQKLV